MWPLCPQVQICSWESDWSRRQTDMIPLASANLDELLCHLGFFSFLFFFQPLSRNSGRLPLSLQSFSIPAPQKNPFYLRCHSAESAAASLCQTREANQLCVIKEKCIYLESQAEMAFGHLNLKVYFSTLPTSLLPPFFSAHNRISWECVKYCMLCTVHL